MKMPELFVDKHTKRRGNRGIALVMVLAFVVLLTGLVVAYFSQSITDRQLSNSSFSQAAADQLANSALAIITGDLKQEIVNGSDAQTPNPDWSPVYVSNSNAYMVPARNGVPSNWSTTGTTNTTLLRVSSTTAIVSSTSPAVDQLASNALSTGTSANGRSVSPARWNQHYLIPLQNSPPDTTPDKNFTAPSWVFVTGTGPAVLTSPATSVIGRYAYAIYDESALLDVNEAGYPIASGTTTSYASKGALAFADLTQLTAGASTTPLINQAGVNNLVGWRNYASLQATGTFPSLTFSSANIPNTYRNLILSNTNGFMTVSRSTTNASTDQAFLSRQELISLAMATNSANPGNFNLNALQYLGTFSRAVTSPSWRPTADSDNLPGYVSGITKTSPVKYLTNKDTAGTPNRDLLNLRWPNSATVTHYNDDGTTTTYSVNAGDQFVQRRFSLARLAWVTYEGPSADLPKSDPLYNAAGTDANIQACFGLIWSQDDLGNPCWRYVGPTGSTAQPSIETLDVVMAETKAREPNFFEMLKAGILNGSLGKDPGVCPTAGGKVADMEKTGATLNGNGQGGGPCGTGFNLYKTSQDQQIVQIGANLLAQYSSAGYPTAIYFSIAPDPKNAPFQEPINVVYGEENLPYMTEFDFIDCAKDASDYGGWFQPVLWNPHQAAPSASGTIPHPTNFRIVAYGDAQMVYYTNGADGGQYGTSINFDTAPANTQNALIYFTDANTGGSSSPFYDHPQQLNTSNADTKNTPSVNVWNSTITSLVGDSNNKFVGFLIGPISHYDPDPNPSWCDDFAIMNPMVTFCLQYKDSLGNYRPYAYVSRILATLSSSLGNGENGAAYYGRGGATWPKAYDDRADPRTDRFSIAYNDDGYGAHHEPNPTPSGLFTYACRTTYQWGVPQGSTTVVDFSPTSCPPASASGFVYKNNPGTANTTGAFGQLGEFFQNVTSTTSGAGYTYYPDPDGVVRSADGFRRDTSIGHGCVLYAWQADQPSSVTGNWSAHRPVILNRPFRSVGEMGYAFRDLPGKTLDFWSTTSADAALLDLFSVQDEPVVAAGCINPNNASIPVLQSLIAGTMQNESTSLTCPATPDANTLAKDLAKNLAAVPLTNRADLVDAVSTTITTATTGTLDLCNKVYGETPIRALSSVTNTRTWNLMIDVIAQTGSFPPGAPSTPAALNSSFNVQGERRYWLHVAIDRMTGKIVDEQLEPVYE